MSELWVQWKDGTFCGILGNLEETMARRRAHAAEEACKQALRDQKVVVLEDWRNHNE